jgi:hypothetical protein
VIRTGLFGVLMAVLFAGFFGAHWATTHHRSAPLESQPAETPLTHALTGVARTISRRDDVWVRCGDTGDPAVLGSVGFYGTKPGNEALLAPVICSTLGRLREGRLPSLDCTRLGGGQCSMEVIRLAWATSALAHESFHLAGVRNEAAAECYGLQATALAASSLGAPAGYAQTLEDYTFWNVRPPIDGGYFSAECKDGGKLDLRPGDHRWP